MKNLVVVILLAVVSNMNIAKAAQTNHTIVPEVKKTIVNYVIKNRTSTEAFERIKEISLSAVDFIQTEGESSSEKLEELIQVVSRSLEKEAIVMKREDIVATIISAINS